jgi:hypothetical protein
MLRLPGKNRCTVKFVRVVAIIFFVCLQFKSTVGN